MSREAEALVWKRSRAKGSNLLVLVKIADWASDDGHDAFASAKTLAEWTRMTDRALRYILHKLEEDGEIVIEPNLDGRFVVIGKRRFQPEWFIHVRCVADWETYQTESEKFSSSHFKRGRKPDASKSEKSSGSEDSGTGTAFTEIGKITYGNRKNHVRKSEKSCSAYKERSVSDLLDQLKAGAPPLTHTPEDPNENLGVITKLAHETIDLVGPKADLGDLAEGVKARCATLRIAYHTDVVRKAVDCALHQRERLQRPA